MATASDLNSPSYLGSFPIQLHSTHNCSQSIVHRPRIRALRTLVKHRLPLVDAPQLHRVKSHLGRPALDARLLDHHPFRLAQISQRRLLLVRLGPQGHGPVGRRGRSRGEGVRGIIGEVGLVLADGAADRARAVDGQGVVAAGTEGPHHGTLGGYPICNSGPGCSRGAMDASASRNLASIAIMNFGAAAASLLSACCFVLPNE